MKSGNFKFDGGVGSFLGTAIAAYLIVLFTLGIATPWAIVLMQKWKTSHTLIEGHRLRFYGEGSALFGKWVIWWILTIITFGIYSFWVIPNMQKWLVEHTDFS